MPPLNKMWITEISFGAGAPALARRASTSPQPSDPKTPSDPTFKNARLSIISASVVVNKFLRIEQYPQNILIHLRTRSGRDTLEHCGLLLWIRAPRNGS